MLKTNIEILEKLHEFIYQAEGAKEKYVTKKNAFTKPRKLGFLMVVLFILQLPKRSLGVELEDFFDQLAPDKLTCTKSAFSQARYNLKWELFRDWNDCLIKDFFTDNEAKVKRWKGYRLQGVDGTILHLPDYADLKIVFGTHSNQHGSMPMARVIGRYDLLNDLLIEGKVAPVRTSENVMAQEQLSQVAEDVLSIYDRNFISFEFLYAHYYQNLHYVMRCKLSFNTVVKNFVKSEAKSAIVEFKASSKGIAKFAEQGIELTLKDSVKLRLIKVVLSTGELEVLATSLLNEQEFPNELFGPLYNSRWGSETCFDVLKNKLQVALFSGQKPAAIHQEFQATVFVHNLNTLLVQDCEEQAKQRSSKRMYQYKINKNVSIGLMKNKLIRLFTCPKEELYLVVKMLHSKFIRYLEPIRQGRSYPRKFRARALKSKFFTLNNYARAF